MTSAVYVYRCYDPEQRLLYVGQSKNPLVRWRQHMFEHTWWAERVTYWQVEVWPNREAARIAERDAIVHEHPIYNSQHFGTQSRTLWSQEQYVAWTRAQLENPCAPSNIRQALAPLKTEYALTFGRNLTTDVGRVRAGYRRQYGGTDDTKAWRSA